MTRKADRFSHHKELRSALIASVLALLSSACIVHTPRGPFDCEVSGTQFVSCVPATPTIQLPKLPRDLEP